MIEALLASTILLWVTVVVLALVVFALARQVGVLHERVAPVGALATSAGPQVGEAAPESIVEDLRLRPVRIGGSDPEGRRTLVFFLSPTCPVCKSLLPTLKRVAADEDSRLRLLFASDAGATGHEEFIEEQGLGAFPYLLSTELGLTYRVSKLPFAVLIDAQGVVRAKGIVNTREHLESLFEAHAEGVASIQDYLAKRSDESREAGGRSKG